MKVNVERRLFLGGAKGEQRPRQETSDPSGSKDLTRPNLGPKSMLKKFGKRLRILSCSPLIYGTSLENCLIFSPRFYTTCVESLGFHNPQTAFGLVRTWNFWCAIWCSLGFQTPFIEGMTRPQKTYHPNTLSPQEVWLEDCRDSYQQGLLYV